MSRKSLLALILSVALSASAAFVGTRPAAANAEHEATMKDTEDADQDRRLLQAFCAAQLPLTQAIEVAERLHRGSRAAAARFQLSGRPMYRVMTVSDGRTWENLIDATSGKVMEQETTSSLDDLDRNERSNIVALGSVAQDLSDAVRVAEKAATGKAFGGGLVAEEGKLNFFVVILSDDELKEVRLEPPKAGRKGSVRYRLR
jgi:uncharacterized membrane protein YkoI